MARKAACAAVQQKKRHRESSAVPCHGLACKPHICWYLLLVRRRYWRHEWEGAEQILALALHLFLHLHKQTFALVDVVIHHALHHRTLHVHELCPHFRAEWLAVETTGRGAREFMLDISEGLHVLFQVG